MAACHVLTYVGTAIEFLRRRQHTPQQPIVSGIGAILFLLGFLLRRWAINTLGSYWSLQIEIRPDQSLIRTGPYRFIRHPNYAALFLEVLSIPLIGNAYVTFFAVMLCYCPLIMLRLAYEERVLLEVFPQAYRHYQRECGALFPRLFIKRTAENVQG
ncbi:MAG: DUF1295 domain-containing protein [Candidatus Omnitrophica bacterium]|nr:DUF1295 domain-containing protein [Candidatus Omnitrophota bacterium]